MKIKTNWYEIKNQVGKAYTATIIYDEDTMEFDRMHIRDNGALVVELLSEGNIELFNRHGDTIFSKENVDDNLIFTIIGTSLSINHKEFNKIIEDLGKLKK